MSVRNYIFAQLLFLMNLNYQLNKYMSMKKIIYSILSILFVPAVLMLYSYNSGSPGGKSGSTGDGGTNCTQCHAGTAVAQSGWITSNIPDDGYAAGETYTITVTASHSGVVKMGYELTAETPMGSKKGVWIITDAGRTKLANANAAVTHTAGGTAPNGDIGTWSANWTAPTAGTGLVRFNTAVNAANGNGSTSGDQIYTSVLTVGEVAVLNPQIVFVDPNNGRQGTEGDYLISGSETLWTDGVEDIVFKYHDDNNITIVPQSFAIDDDTEITVVLSIPFEQEIGSYDVWVDDIMLDDGFTVDIVDAVSDHIETSVRIYPNPAKDYINLELPEGSEFRISSINGRQLSDFKVFDGKETINLSDLENGVYFIQIISNGESFIKKFIKK